MKDGNPVCKECRGNFPQVYHACENPCSQLLLFIADIQAKRVAHWSAESVKRLKSEYEDYLDGILDPRD